MRLKSRVAPLLAGPKFQELIESSYSENLDEAIRNHFPEKHVDTKQFGNVNIVSITNDAGDIYEVISWYEDQQPRDSDIGENVEEKKEIDAAIKDLGLSVIGPSIKEATERTKEYFGIYEGR